jgi:hypothetical protein
MVNCPHCGREIGDINGPGVPGKRATSRAAGQIDRRTDRHWVLWTLRDSRSATADLVTLRLADRWSPNQTGARMLELRKAGFVTFDRDINGRKLKGTTRTGSTAFLQKLTPAGRVELERLGDPRELEHYGT